MGFDPRGTNIAARIKDWMTYHHIHSFFDYLLQIPNDFFLHPHPEAGSEAEEKDSGEKDMVKIEGGERKKEKKRGVSEEGSEGARKRRKGMCSCPRQFGRVLAIC